MYRERYTYSLNKVYQAVGISKQAVSSMINQLLKKKDEQMQLIRCIHDIREDHPTMGVRDIYNKLLPDCMGRDAFERFCKEHDLMSKKVVNYSRTTDSSGVIRFDNLIENLSITGINQV